MLKIIEEFCDKDYIILIIDASKQMNFYIFIDLCAQEKKWLKSEYSSISQNC